MTTMTMRMIKSRNIHPPQSRVGKEGSGRHLRYLILLQPTGDGGVLFVFLFPFSYLSQVLSVFVHLAGLYVFTQPVEGQVIPCTSFQVHAYHICILFVCYNWILSLYLWQLTSRSYQRGARQGLQKDPDSCNLSIVTIFLQLSMTKPFKYANNDPKEKHL